MITTAPLWFVVIFSGLAYVLGWCHGSIRELTRSNAALQEHVDWLKAHVDALDDYEVDQEATDELREALIARAGGVQ